MREWLLQVVECRLELGAEGGPMRKLRRRRATRNGAAIAGSRVASLLRMMVGRLPGLAMLITSGGLSEWEETRDGSGVDEAEWHCSVPPGEDAATTELDAKRV